MLWAVRLYVIVTREMSRQLEGKERVVGEGCPGMGLGASGDGGDGLEPHARVFEPVVAFKDEFHDPSFFGFASHRHGVC